MNEYVWHRHRALARQISPSGWAILAKFRRFATIPQILKRNARNSGKSQPVCTRAILSVPVCPSHSVAVPPPTAPGLYAAALRPPVYSQPVHRDARDLSRVPRAPSTSEHLGLTRLALHVAQFSFLSFARCCLLTQHNTHTADEHTMPTSSLRARRRSSTHDDTSRHTALSTSERMLWIRRDEAGIMGGRSRTGQWVADDRGSGRCLEFRDGPVTNRASGKCICGMIALASANFASSSR